MAANGTETWCCESHSLQICQSSISSAGGWSACRSVHGLPLLRELDWCMELFSLDWIHLSSSVDRYLEDFQWIGTSRLENYYPTGPTDFPAAKDLSIQSSQPLLAACSVASPLTFALAPPWQPDKQKTILARGWCFAMSQFYWHPRNLTWNPKMKVWKMFFLFTWVILRFHVSFPGCTRFPFNQLLQPNMFLKAWHCEGPIIPIFIIQVFSDQLGRLVKVDIQSVELLLIAIG